MSQDKTFLWSVFRSVDVDGSGDITANELQKALSNGTWTPFNPETVRLMIGMFDKDHSGSIDYDEFAALWNYVSEWQKCFRTYDTDKSGAIDEDELKHALISFGYRLSDSLIHYLMIKFDRQGCYSIAFDDFIQCCVVLEVR
ncbi:hypothetical protein NP493_10g05037 [Ridgeia piscesae]|uniref:EF-hand domain-containing protein n=1 Tax=Ridgeia piscesae TaxID=27915 RepID=A0AAD9PF70_RIDPI|nr:hypothetical protein NP493_10g05037 [Ridgeia piscesae]